MDWLRSKVFQLFRKDKTYTAKGSYLQYGSSDDYPLMLMDLIQNSSSLSTAIDVKANFIAGQGDPTVNDQDTSKEDNFFDLVEETAWQLSAFTGFCWKVGFKYNNNTVTYDTDVKIQPFEFFRWKDADKKIGIILRVNDYNALEVAQELPVFNNIVEMRAEAQKVNWNNFECLYVDYLATSKALIYPRASYNSVLKDALAEKELKQSKYRDIRSGFAARIVATVYGTAEPTKEQAEQDQEDFEEFCGSESATFMLRYAQSRDSKADFDVINAPIADKLYEYSERSVSDNIMRQFRIPPVLYGVATAGKLGTTQEFEDAINYMQNFVVKKEQKIIEKAFKNIFEINYKIQPIKMVQDDIQNGVPSLPKAS